MQNSIELHLPYYEIPHLSPRYRALLITIVNHIENIYRDIVITGTTVAIAPVIFKKSYVNHSSIFP